MLILTRLKKLALLTTGAALLTLDIGSTAQAGVLFSDNFNSENSGAAALNYTSFANWDVTDGTVDLIGNGYFDVYPGNGLFIDLDGSSSKAGVLTTKATFDPGQYFLKFALGGSTNSTENVTVNFGSYSELFTLAGSDPLAEITRIITLGAASKLSFSNAGGDNVGAKLDNVSVASAATAVPTPALLPGLIALGVGVLRKRKAESVEDAPEA